MTHVKVPAYGLFESDGEPGPIDRVSRSLGVVAGTEILAIMDDSALPPVDVAVYVLFARGPGLVSAEPRRTLVDGIVNSSLSRLDVIGATAEDGDGLIVSEGIPMEVGAKQVVVISLGEPALWTAATMYEASRAAIAQALRLDATSGSFSPCFAEAVRDSSGVAFAFAEIGRGTVEALSSHQPMQRGTGEIDTALKRWIFDIRDVPFASAIDALADTIGRHATSNET